MKKCDEDDGDDTRICVGKKGFLGFFRKASDENKAWWIGVGDSDEFIAWIPLKGEWCPYCHDKFVPAAEALCTLKRVENADIQHIERPEIR